MIYSREILFLLALCTAFAMPASAVGQEESDLQRENERLAEENSRLMRELEVAKQRIAMLEQELTRLARRLQEAQDGQSAQAGEEDDEEAPKPGSVDESQPDASPRALLRALVDRYEQAMGEMELGPAGSRERAAYMRALSNWRAAQRELQSNIEWHVRVEETESRRGGLRMSVRAIDPANDEQLGEPFHIELSRAQARRYEQAVRDGAELFVLRGTLTPVITINTSRATPGPFNNPPLIGPFAEFGFTVQIRTLLPAERQGEE